MIVVSRAPGYADLSLSLDEVVTISYALGRVLRCRELQMVDVVIGFTEESLRELQQSFRSLWDRDSTTAELSLRSIQREQHIGDDAQRIFVTEVENTPPAVTVRLSHTTALVVANALMIVRGEMAPSEAETLLNCTDDALARLFFDFRSVATGPRALRD